MCLCRKITVNTEGSPFYRAPYRLDLKKSDKIYSKEVLENYKFYKRLAPYEHNKDEGIVSALSNKR